MKRSKRQLFLFRLFLVAAIALTATLFLAALLIAQGSVSASSHREAPLISQDAYADNTDTYAFVSPANADNVVLIASWIPAEGPENGPNYYGFDDNAQYHILVDNDGDAMPDITYTLASKTTILNPLTFLYNTGPIDSLADTDWNMRQTYTLTEQFEGDPPTVLLSDVSTPPVNIGQKSTPDYAALHAAAIYDVSEGGDDIQVFAGPTDDAFWVDLQVFDLLTIRGQAPPVGYDSTRNIPIDSLSGLNVHSLVLEIPIDRLTQGSEPVLGVWATTTRPETRVLSAGAQSHSGPQVQISRLGMPLVNEAVIPLALKDAFNSLEPYDDVSVYLDPGTGYLLQESVENPELGRLLCGLYAVPLPEDSDADCNSEFTPGTPASGRSDLFEVFLTGMTLKNEFVINTASGPITLPVGFNVNQPVGVQPAEMIRVNTAISGDLCSPTPSRLGILGGDACGFPNGRRLADDVIEIELLAVAGAAYGVLDASHPFSFNSDLIAVLDDSLDGNDMPFQDDFPYIAPAQSGETHWHQNIQQELFPVMLNTTSVLKTTVQEHPAATAAVTLSGGALLFGVPALVWRRRRDDRMGD